MTKHPTDRAAATVCRHRWRIATPNGPISPGVCRLCGEQRDFPTTTEESAWGATSTDQPLRPRVRRTSRADSPPS
jgi:hypothetical protein